MLPPKTPRGGINQQFTMVMPPSLFTSQTQSQPTQLLMKKNDVSVANALLILRSRVKSRTTTKQCQ